MAVAGDDALDCMRAIDQAWNARDWTAYAALLDPALVAHASGEETPHGKAEHVQRARAFCAVFPGARVHTEPYLALFADPHGSRTCSVARMSGTACGQVRLPDGGVLELPQPRVFEISFAAICQWRQGRITGQRQYVDLDLLLRQLRGPTDHSPRNSP